MRKDLPAQAWTNVSGDGSMPIVASFVSGDFYRREGWELLRSCQAHGLDYEIVELPDLGDWLANVNRKPSFLLDVSARHPARSILWLDADARVRRAPEILRWLRADVAYHRIHDAFPCDATVFFGRGRARRETLLREWIRLVKSDPTGAELPPDQAAVGAPAQYYFERAVERVGLSLELLPPDYCWLYDLALDRQGTPVEPDHVPVIEQMQANRWAKKLGGAR